MNQLLFSIQYACMHTISLSALITVVLCVNCTVSLYRRGLLVG